VEVRVFHGQPQPLNHHVVDRGLQSVLERDSIIHDASDEVVLNALDGDDLITVDAAFTVPGLVDGGNGTDTCTAPAGWSEVSC
jgi:hypothetical protein